jgi:DNA-binding beta-propeller fold protein YncE
VNNLTSSPGVVTCNIAAGVINPGCFDAGATNMMDSGEGIALNRAGTVAYIADYSMGLFVCSVNGLSVQTSCNLITTVGSITIQGPAGVALNPSESLVYVADYRSNTIFACNTGFTSCVVANQSIPNPASVAINATGTAAYVTNFGSSVYHCSILSDGTFANCTASLPAGLSGAVGMALGY